jgi:hypothetical protein
MDLETALASLPAQGQDLVRRAVYACAIAVPPALYRWRSPQAGTAGRGHLAKPGEVGIRLRQAEDGVVVELSFSDCGPGLPALFDAKAQRALGLELISVLARLVQGSLSDDAASEAVFAVAFVPSHRDFSGIESAA